MISELVGASAWMVDAVAVVAAEENGLLAGLLDEAPMPGVAPVVLSGGVVRDAALLLASPASRPRRVSAILVASALRRYTTWIDDGAAAAVSRLATRLRTRCTYEGFSARTSRLLVRVSAAM